MISLVVQGSTVFTQQGWQTGLTYKINTQSYVKEYKVTVIKYILNTADYAIYRANPEHLHKAKWLSDYAQGRKEIYYRNY